jgi:hypothetical protein
MKVHLGTAEIGVGRYIGLWTAVAVVFAFQHGAQDELGGHTWDASDYLRWSLIVWYVWAALAPLVFRLALKYPIRAPLRLRGLGMQLPLSLGITMLAQVAGALVSVFTESSTLPVQLRQFLGQHFATGLLTYWGLFAIQQAMQFHDEKTRREVETTRLAADLAQSRLRSLKSQLQPHFLFNTLHAIATLLKEDTRLAEDMLLRLSDLLRAFLEDHDGQETSVRRELVLLDLYIGIQKVRFQERLDTHIYVAPDALDAAVPTLILQPIVENAIRHGIGDRLGDDRIDIDVRRDGARLMIEVRNRNSSLDKATGESAQHATGHGIGLKNTALRLRELYGDDAQVRLDISWPKGVVCRIHLPFHLIEDADDMPEVVSA